MVCHRFCPQALAEALKVNQTVTDMNLWFNHIGKEGAKAWCLARGVCGSRPRNGEIKWDLWDFSAVGQWKGDGNKMEERGTVAFQLFCCFLFTFLVLLTCPWTSFSSHVFEAKCTFSFGFPGCTGLVFSNMNVQEMHRPFMHATLFWDHTLRWVSLAPMAQTLAAFVFRVPASTAFALPSDPWFV